MTDTSTAIHADIQIKAAVPTFLVPDVASTARWYSEHLGFRTAGTFPREEPYAYASLQRDAAEIMLLSSPGYEKPDLSRPDVQKGFGTHISGCGECTRCTTLSAVRHSSRCLSSANPTVTGSSKCAIRTATSSCLVANNGVRRTCRITSEFTFSKCINWR